MSTIADEFAEIRPVVAFMAGFTRPWLVAGGWAIDLYLGQKSRGHEDVDIAIFRPDQAAMQEHLAGWHLQKVKESKLEDWTPGEWLALPVHEIHARRDMGDPSDLEILLDERDGDIWRYRKNLEITRPVEKVALHTARGIPFLAPEVALLYKASYYATAGHIPGAAEDKNVGDFERAVPHLEPERRKWLKDAIEACYPGHPWLASTFPRKGMDNVV
jgi:hypothetical protein